MTDKKKHSVLVGLLTGGSATGSAVLFTHPMETMKTRLQLQGELMKRGEGVRVYRGVTHGLRTVLTQEGVGALYAGLGSGVTYQIVMNGTRLGLYDPLREQIAAAYWGDASPSSPGGVAVSIVTGIIVGVAGGFMGSPLFQAKVRLQMGESAQAMGIKAQYNYSGTMDALLDIYRTGGVTSLFRGGTAAMARTGVGSASQLSSYGFCRDVVRDAGVPEGVFQHLSASVLAALVCTTAMNPFDVVMTRIYNQSGDKGKALYKGPLDAFIMAMKTEGLGAFYKGWRAHFARLGPHTILTFVFLEQFKLLASRLGY
uniref:Uncharacterized protein n=1 Tax=Phaeomonas parva TaxID=124430 RepID=A0A7S1XN43_9STRA|eukprot:CAMPEP_0118870362 /NCGR_PEP_ID=MMETSP1163-20130328/13362_1 /TAXON_ID=124430 /ORGANISM="Phaeomonas parva, Strain CCMP2877" /LENGTH=312 /DNA_ID=CAMNT_0006805357 /DNA_START=115 /DNA_END=1053 /DNA_ORIENTATION=+